MFVSSTASIGACSVGRQRGDRRLERVGNRRTGGLFKRLRAERFGAAKGKVDELCAEQLRGDFGQHGSVGKLAA